LFRRLEQVEHGGGHRGRALADTLNATDGTATMRSSCCRMSGSIAAAVRTSTSDSRILFSSVDGHHGRQYRG
jgi:hypothetical protein